MGQVLNTWRLEALLTCGSETFRNHQDVKHIDMGTPHAAPLPTEPPVANWIAFLRDIYYPDVTLVSVFLRNIYYKQGPLPHPEHPPVWQDDINAVGLGNTTFGGAHNANYLPQQVCIFCKKSTSGGRSGKMFMRNVLTEVDVTSAVGGLWAFSNGAGHFDQAVFQGVVTTELAPYMVAAPADSSYTYGVTHLEGIPDADPRTPFSTLQTAFTAVRPTWNQTQR